MKKSITATALALLALCSCSKGSYDAAGSAEELSERQPIVLTKQQQELVSSSNAFSFNIFGEICRRAPGEEIFISPFSLGAALSMLANGAEGSTYAQITATLGCEGLGKAELNAGYRQLTTSLLGADASTTLKIANALWIDNGFPVLPAFASALSENYGATVRNLDFASPKALDTINSWVDGNTGGMIPSLFERLSPDWAYILTNALYFKGIWAKKFRTELTRKEPFHCLSGEVRSVDFMHGEMHCGYAYDEKLGAALCELPFGNRAFLLDILLPDSDFTGFTGRLDAEAWASLTGALRETERYVIIPKFEVSYTGSEAFKEALSALGMDEPFAPGADFSALSNTPTFVSDIIQKARFRIDENGAEAAAVTAVVGKDMEAGPPLEFFADRPFVYAIREFSTGAILFLGACKNL